LEELEVGDQGTVREVQTEEPARLQRWKTMGFTPGSALAMLERHEFEDVMHIGVGGEVVVTGSEGVVGILVELKS
jgi:Fe2+ transport system protein FeoA